MRFNNSVLMNSLYTTPTTRQGLLAPRCLVMHGRRQPMLSHATHVCTHNTSARHNRLPPPNSECCLFVCVCARVRVWRRHFESPIDLSQLSTNDVVHAMFSYACAAWRAGRPGLRVCVRVRANSYAKSHRRTHTHTNTAAFDAAAPNSFLIRFCFFIVVRCAARYGHRPHIF